MESVPSPDALVERVELVGLQRATLEHLDHSRLDAGGTKQTQVRGQGYLVQERGRGIRRGGCTVETPRVHSGSGSSEVYTDQISQLVQIKKNSNCDIRQDPYDLMTTSPP